MLRRVFIVSALLALAGCGGKSKGTQLNPGAKVAIVLRDGARLTKETSQHHSYAYWTSRI
jgi:predicted small lipoprotein YifL